MSKLEAINSNVFVKRDPIVDSVGVIEVSDRAKAESLYGTIIAIGECPFAKVGDRVHIPHYAVQNVEVGGETYAMFKQKRLFFVNGDVVNGYMLVRKCENDHIRDESGEIALFMTDKHIEWTNWVEVLDVADDCEKVSREHIGLYCVAPENDEKLARIGDSKDYALSEELVHFLTEG